MFDYEENMDRYLDNIRELVENKQYAAVRDLLLPWSRRTSPSFWRRPVRN